MSVTALPVLRRRQRMVAHGEWRAIRRRRMISRGYEQLLADARRPQRGLTARVPVQRDQVVAAAPDIERLIRRLRDVERPVDQRALDAARALICDDGGPIFTWAEPGSLRRRVRLVSEAME